MYPAVLEDRRILPLPLRERVGVRGQATRCAYCVLRIGARGVWGIQVNPFSASSAPLRWVCLSELASLGLLHWVWLCERPSLGLCVATAQARRRARLAVSGSRDRAPVPCRSAAPGWRQASADPRQDCVARGAVLLGHPYLDELVAFQVLVDLAQHGVGQTRDADHHDGVEPVGVGFEQPALGGGELDHLPVLLRRGFYNLATIRCPLRRVFCASAPLRFCAREAKQWRAPSRAKRGCTSM